MRNKSQAAVETLLIIFSLVSLVCCANVVQVNCTTSTKTTPYPSDPALHIEFQPTKTTNYTCKYKCYPDCDNVKLIFNTNQDVNVILICENPPGNFCGKIVPNGTYMRKANLTLKAPGADTSLFTFDPVPTGILNFCHVETLKCGTNTTWESPTPSYSSTPSTTSTASASSTSSYSYSPSGSLAPSSSATAPPSTSPPPPPSEFPLDCLVIPNSPPDICYIGHNVSVFTPIFTLRNYSAVIVLGGVVLYNRTTTIITSGQTFSGSSITFGGSLLLNLSSSDLDKLGSGEAITIPIAQFNDSDGAFDLIQLQGAGISEGLCQTVEYGEHSLSVIISQSCEETQNDGVNKKMVAGVVAGVGGFVILVVIGLIIATVVVVYIKTKRVESSVALST